MPSGLSTAGWQSFLSGAARFSNLEKRHGANITLRLGMSLNCAKRGFPSKRAPVECRPHFVRNGQTVTVPLLDYTPNMMEFLETVRLQQRKNGHVTGLVILPVVTQTPIQD